MSFENKSIEDVKLYWNNGPCNIRHSNKPFGTKEYFDEVEIRKYFVEPHIPKFAEFHKWENKKVLEIGCGIGTDSVNFVKSGADLTCVDLSDESLNVCKKRFDVYNMHAKFYNANAEQLSDVVPVEPYDLVYSFGVLHHTPRPQNALLELKKYMHKDSQLRIMMYHKVSFKTLEIMQEYDTKVITDLDSIIAMHSEAQSGCPVTYSYTKTEIVNLLEECGYKVNSVKVDHIFPYDVDEYKKYNYKLNEIWEQTSPEFLRYMEKLYGWHLLVTAVL